MMYRATTLSMIFRVTYYLQLYIAIPSLPVDVIYYQVKFIIL